MEYIDWVSFISSFVLVIVLLGGTLWGLKRFGRMQLQKATGDAKLAIIDQVSVGTRQRIVLIETDGQRMLVGVTPHSISGLGQWPTTKASDLSFQETVNRIEEADHDDA